MKCAKKGDSMAERVLTLRELNRATLTRQLLLERASLAPLTPSSSSLACKPSYPILPISPCGAVYMLSSATT